MKCPVCDVPLKMSERQGIEIDYCPKCRGVWLDRGELDKIIDRSQAYEQQTATPTAPPPQKHSYFDDDVHVAKSKRDDRYDDDYRYDDRKRDKDRYDDDDRYKYDKRPKYKKRKSVLSEIFDIFD